MQVDVGEGRHPIHIATKAWVIAGGAFLGHTGIKAFHITRNNQLVIFAQGIKGILGLLVYPKGQYAKIIVYIAVVAASPKGGGTFTTNAAATTAGMYFTTITGAVAVTGATAIGGKYGLSFASGIAAAVAAAAPVLMPWVLCFTSPVLAMFL